MQPAHEIVAEDQRRSATERVAQRPEVVDERVYVAQNESVAKIDRLYLIEIRRKISAGSAARSDPSLHESEERHVRCDEGAIHGAELRARVEEADRRGLAQAQIDAHEALLGGEPAEGFGLGVRLHGRKKGQLALLEIKRKARALE